MRKQGLLVFSLLGCLFILYHSRSALATTAIIPQDQEMVVESRAIVTGRVTEISTGVDRDTQLVYTYIRLDVSRVLKGEIAEREIVLKELGGETRELGTMIFGMPRFDLGQPVLLFLNTWPDGALRVHQGFLGKFEITEESSTGRLFVERRMIDQNVLLVPTSGNGTSRSELGAYTSLIEDLIRTNRKGMRDFERRFFSGVPMLAQPTEFRSPRPGAHLTPQWVLLNPASPSRWFEADNNQPVVFYVNPTGAPSFAKLQEDVQAAMDAWSKADASIRVVYGGTSGGCGVQFADGSNTISFNNCDSYFAASQGCSGLLAVSGIIRYMPSQTKNIGGTTFGKAVEAKMSFNPYALCNFKNRCQLQEVITHEMGHALGLGHSSDSSSTMLAFAHFDNRCASLMLDDARGIDAIYPGGSSSSQLSIMTSSLPFATAETDYTASLEASGGSGMYHWSLVGGQLPSGLQLGMSGLLFGNAGANGSFGFTTQVSDLSGNISQRSLTLVVRQPGLAPVITDAQFRRKRIFVSGDGLQENATVYVDGEGLSATLDGTTLMTGKRKLKSGVHQVYVVNPDGKQSAAVQLVVE